MLGVFAYCHLPLARVSGWLARELYGGFYQQHLQHTYCTKAADQPDCVHRKHAVLCQSLRVLDNGAWLMSFSVPAMSAVEHPMN